ncbi:MAG: 50S ribosomal protein L24 [Patescibacteria group bacterium]|jgi:large subunit ribosomal protein L24
MKIKTNDKVKILSGKDKGKIGKVIQVFPTEGKLVVEGMNIIKKHLRSRSKTEKGQVLELSAPFSVSKAMLVCSKCEKTVRVGYKTEGGKKFRYCRKCSQPID